MPRCPEPATDTRYRPRCLPGARRKLQAPPRQSQAAPPPSGSRGQRLSRGLAHATAQGWDSCRATPSPRPWPPSRSPAPWPHGRQRPVPVPATRPAPPQLRASLHRLQPGHGEKPPAPKINVCYEPRLLEGGARRHTQGAVYRGRVRLRHGLPMAPRVPSPVVAPPVMGASGAGGLRASPSPQRRAQGCQRSPHTLLWRQWERPGGRTGVSRSWSHCTHCPPAPREQHLEPTSHNSKPPHQPPEGTGQSLGCGEGRVPCLGTSPCCAGGAGWAAHGWLLL